MPSICPCIHLSVNFGLDKYRWLDFPFVVAIDTLGDWLFPVLELGPFDLFWDFIGHRYSSAFQ